MKVIDKVDNRYVIETKICLWCGNKGKVEILSRELFEIRQGALIQDAVKSLDKELREQLISGTHSNCWNEMFGYGLITDWKNNNE